MSDSTARGPAPRRSPHPVLILAAVVVVLLAALAFVARAVPVDAMRPRLERAFQRDTGRTLTIGGPLRLTLLPSPGLEARDVAIGNLPGGSRPEMARARALGLSVALLPLLGGELRITTLRLDDPDLLLERLPDGTPNWRFTPAAHAPVPGSEQAHHRRFDVALAELDATGGRLTWHDRGGIGSGAIALDRVRLVPPSATNAGTLVVDGRHGTAPFHLSLSGARHDPGAATPWPFRATLAAGTGPDAAALAFAGTIVDPARGRGLDGRLDARVPDLAALDALFPHARLPDVRGLAGTASIGSRSDGRPFLRAVAVSGQTAALDRWRPGLRIARFAVRGDAPTAPLAVDAAGTIDGTPFTVAGRAIGTLALLSGVPGTAPLDAAITLGRDRLAVRGTATRDDGSAAGGGGNAFRPLVGPGRIDAAAAALALPDPDLLAALLGHPIGWHRALAVDGPATVVFGAGGARTLTVDARRWSLDGHDMPPLAGVLALTPGFVDARLALAPGASPFLAWHGGRGPGNAPATLSVTGRGLPAGPLLWAFAATDGLDGRLDATATLSGQARGLAFEPDTLGGPVALTLEAATLDRALARRLLGPVLSIAARLPLPPLETVAIRCASLDGRFEAGVLAASALSLDSPTLVLNGSGQVDFGRARLALALRPTVRLGMLGAATDVAVDGPFAAPAARLAPGAGGRFALAVGPTDARAACDAAPDLGPAPRRKAPRAVDILRGLGLFR